MFMNINCIYVRNRRIVYLIVVFLGIFLLKSACLEFLNFLCDTGLALFESKSLGLVFETLRFPVLGFFCGLELRVLTYGGVRVCVDFLDIVGADSVS